MKEDLAISKEALNRTQEENRQLLVQLKGSQQRTESRAAAAAATTGKKGSTSGASSSSPSSGDNEELSDVVDERDALRRELSLQMSMKAEMEMAMKLLEKDVHDKQDTVVALREQLDDIKKINLELYVKLQVRCIKKNNDDAVYPLQWNLVVEDEKGNFW